MKEVELKDITFSYGEVEALKDFSYSFDAGKTYTLEGPNGCGKSTLFRIMAGLSFPEKGTYTFYGKNITEKLLKKEEESFELHRRLGYLFQNTEVQLFTGSVEDEILFGLSQIYDMSDKEQEEKCYARVEKYIDLFGLQSLRGRAPFNLSGGEKKRVALAAVLAMEPEVLILDEPISGLDEEGQKWITDFLIELKGSNKLMIIATHNKEFAKKIADIRVDMRYMN